MHPGDEYSDEEIKKRFKLLYGDEKKHNLGDEQIPSLREKWADLSEYVKEVKQSFSCFYNRLHNRKGFFWSDRFKSVIVDNGETLINCLAYIDLNPVRAGIVEKPENYRWNSIGYHIQTNNKDGFLSLDFGLREFGPSGMRAAVTSEFHGASLMDGEERLKYYRKFVYEKGYIDVSDGAQIKKDIVEKERGKGFEISGSYRFRYRTRYFTDSGIIGTKAFVAKHYQAFQQLFSCKHEKRPKTIHGLDGIYSLKRLSEKA